MSTTVRWISVDDTDPDIGYVGNSWFPDVGSLDSIGNNGPPFLSTLHGTNSSASFTFNYTGSGLRVMGTYTGTPNATTMDWTCFVDGFSALGKTFPTASDFYQNALMFCSLPSTPDGSHAVSVNVTVGENQTFWFDKIQYIPSASVSLENKTIQLDETDSAIVYGSGWSNYETQTNSSQLECTFTGISVTWYGTELSGNSTTGTWTIDDNSPTTFIVNGLGTNTTPTYNEIYFQSPLYSMGSHKLIVTYNGDNSTTPLNLAYLVVKNGTLPTSSTGSSSQATKTSSTDTAPATTSNMGAILGGVLGGTACLLIVIVFFYRYRRGSRKDRAHTDSSFSYIASTHRSSSRPDMPDTEVSALRPRKTQGQPLVVLAPGRPQDEQMMENPSRIMTIAYGEEHRPGPRKLQNPTSTVEGVAPNDDQHFRQPVIYLSNHAGGAIGPVEFIDQEGVVRPVSHRLPEALMDAPPAYSHDQGT